MSIRSTALACSIVESRTAPHWPVCCVPWLSMHGVQWCIIPQELRKQHPKLRHYRLQHPNWPICSITGCCTTSCSIAWNSITGCNTSGRSTTCYSVTCISIPGYSQGGKSTHFRKIYISTKTAEFVIWIPKSLILRSEWGNTKEWNKYPRAILNMRRRGGQKRNLSLFCSNSQHDRS